MLTFDEERQAIRDAISRFPKYFNLPGGKDWETGKYRTCRISESNSFFSGDTLFLYVEMEFTRKWESYAKGTEAELKAAIRQCNQNIPARD